MKYSCPASLAVYEYSYSTHRLLSGLPVPIAYFLDSQCPSHAIWTASPADHLSLDDRYVDRRLPVQPASWAFVANPSGLPVVATFVEL
jgi:hypothetical protein